MAMHTRTGEEGFTLVELLIGSVITMVVMGVAFSTFKDALALNDSAVQLSDASQNLRTGANLLVRDLLQAGRNLPTGGIAIPSGAGVQALQRPGPTGTSYTFDNTSQTTLQAITSGNALGPVVAGKATDMVTIIMDDPLLAPLTLEPSTFSGAVPKLAADGSTFNVSSQTAWLNGNATDAIAPIKPGDLIYFLSSKGSAIQTVTAVTSPTVTFAANDPFKFNQRSAPAGSITQIKGVTMTARRVFMYTYYVKEEAAGLPRLYRAVNFSTPQALAGVIESLDLSYDLVDGDVNPTDQPTLPFTLSGTTYLASQIRKANLKVGVRSETKVQSRNDYLRSNLSTVVAIRNLSYVDRYK